MNDTFATSKGVELSYKLGYLNTAALFHPIRTYIIRILWISTLRGHYPYFMDIIHILWILWICLYYLYVSHYKLLSS